MLLWLLSIPLEKTWFRRMYKGKIGDFGGGMQMNKNFGLVASEGIKKEF